MVVNISEKALEIIREKTNEIIVKKQLFNSWAGSCVKPAVVAGKPNDIENYKTVEVDGLTVYVNVEEGNNSDISIDLRGVGPFRHFVVEGLWFNWQKNSLLLWYNLNID